MLSPVRTSLFGALVLVAVACKSDSKPVPPPVKTDPKTLLADLRAGKKIDPATFTGTVTEAKELDAKLGAYSIVIAIDAASSIGLSFVDTEVAKAVKVGDVLTVTCRIDARHVDRGYIDAVSCEKT